MRSEGCISFSKTLTRIPERGYSEARLRLPVPPVLASDSTVPGSQILQKWLGLVDFLQSQKVLDYFFAARFIKDIGVHPIAFQPDGCGEMKFADNCF